MARICVFCASSERIDPAHVDLGYAVGAVLAGVTADTFGLAAAMWVVAGLTFLSGLVSAVRMTETLPSLKEATLRQAG